MTLQNTVDRYRWYEWTARSGKPPVLVIDNLSNGVYRVMDLEGCLYQAYNAELVSELHYMPSPSDFIKALGYPKRVNCPPPPTPTLNEGPGWARKVERGLGNSVMGDQRGPEWIG